MAAAILGVIALLAVLSPPDGMPATAFNDPGTTSGDPACAGITPLTDAQRVAQVLGAPLRDPVMTAEVAEVAATRAGTIVLLGAAIQDVDQLARLVADLDAQAPVGLPPVIAVDEEGGRVARFGRSGLTTHLPSARVQAAEGSPAVVEEQARGLGAQLASFGVDLNLAPVLDLSADVPGSIIGDRSFSPDPALAGEYGAAFAAGMQQAGVATTGKHFPDHGLTTTDTHGAVALVDVPLDQLRGRHLQPYRRALPHLDSIMLSHLRIPALDPDRPVSLSPSAVAFLRTELAYEGVVVTDDLSMQAVAAVADQPTAAVLALQAGVDLVLVGSPQAAVQAHDRLLAAVQSGDVAASRLQQAVRRVLRLRGLPPQEITCLAGPGHYRRPR